MELVAKLDTWLSKNLDDLKYHPNTKTYIINVLSNPRSLIDFSDRSIVTIYADTKVQPEFTKYQQIGDWVLWISTIHPLNVSANRDLTETIGQLSYQTCYRMLQKSWPIYDDLARSLPQIIVDVRANLKKNNLITLL